jgi:hypothetical protein
MLDFGYIETRGPVGVPRARVNGGLFTGELFEHNAPWGNGVPVPPEARAYMHAHQSMPMAAQSHVPGFERPGNNAQDSGSLFDKKYDNLYCAK